MEKGEFDGKDRQNLVIDEEIKEPYKYLDEQITTDNEASKKKNQSKQSKPHGLKGSKSFSAEKAKIIKLAIIFLGIILVIVALGVSCSSFTKSIGLNQPEKQTNAGATLDYQSPYIAVLHVEGTIYEDSSSDTLLSSSSGSYNHEFTLKTIDSLMQDTLNKGLVLYINSPGGSVYASDELYNKIKEYQEKTGRPVYSAMGSQATSGGYYISAPCDKIIANRNCWTGSIGVTIGTIYDISGLLDKLGIKTQTITSGANKAMGSDVEPMTEEQKEIFQGLVDEAYEQFVDIVSQERDMIKQNVKKIADGRIYTAKQALKNGLIDKIGTLDEALEDMENTYQLGQCDIADLEPVAEGSIGSLLLKGFENKDQSLTDADKIGAIMGLNDKFKVTYMSTVEK